MQHGECYDSQGCTELQKSINYLTFSGTTVSTSIRFPRSSLPRLVNLVHTAVLECCTKFSTRVLNLVPFLNLALTRDLTSIIIRQVIRPPGRLLATARLIISG